MAGYQVGSLDLPITSNYDKSVDGIDKTIKKLQSLNRVMNKLSKVDLSSSMQKNGYALSSFIGRVNGFSGGGMGSLFNLAKMGTIIHQVRRLGGYISDVVQAGSDYTESLNMWQVSMRENLNLAERFVTKMNKAYGISERTLMNTQATFKNMIGSLGQISDETAYALSESLTQMAVDYSSLYNVQLTKAFEKFQAMLAGQVRPIRSVSGLDITETTLFQLYQSIGGTKSMRQLTRTEKQLLSILSVYKQMGRAGALGDMTKTLNQFANQSRMMTEYWAQLKTWTGVVLKDLVEDSKILVYINASLITMSEIMRAIAKARGADQENFIDGLYQSVTDTNTEIDELQGKLLDFDKFRSLSGASDNVLGVDEAVLNAVTGYSSNIDKANNEAQNLATEWLKILGFTENANGELVPMEGALENLTTKATNFVGALIGIPLAIKGISLIPSIVTTTTNAMSLFTKVGSTLKLSLLEIATTSKLTSGNVTLLGKAFEFLTKHPVIAIIGAIVGVLAYLYTTNEDVRDSINRLFASLMPLFNVLGDFISNLLTPFGDLLSSITNIIAKGLVVAIDLLAVGLNVLLLSMTPMMYTMELTLKVLQSIFEVLNALLSLDFSQLGSKLGSLWKKWDSTDFAKGTWSNFSNLGGTISPPDNESLFTAKEQQVVYGNQIGGNSISISQIKEATKQGTMEALNSWWGGNNARADIPQLEETSETGLYQVVTSVAGRFGKGWKDK